MFFTDIKIDELEALGMLFENSKCYLEIKSTMGAKNDLSL